MGEVFSQRRGSGPALLLVCGGSGDSRVYDPLAQELAHEWTVLTYDLPGHARSGGSRDRDITVTGQAEVAAAVLADHGHQRAVVFGSSSGALVAIELTMRHPELVVGLIAHEPPLLHLLPDGEQVRARFTSLVEENARGRTIPAYARFLAEIDFGAGFTGRSGPLQLPTREELAYFLGRELPQVASYRPELSVLRAGGVPVTPLAGAANRDKFYARGADALAEQLGVDCVEVPGAHMAYLVGPAEFAEALRPILADLRVADPV